MFINMITSWVILPIKFLVTNTSRWTELLLAGLRDKELRHSGQAWSRVAAPPHWKESPATVHILMGTSLWRVSSHCKGTLGITQNPFKGLYSVFSLVWEWLGVPPFSKLESRNPFWICCQRDPNTDKWKKKNE